MARRRRNESKQARPTSGMQATLPAPRARRFGFLQLTRRSCLTTGGYALAVASCALAGYLWWAPLPTLAVPPVQEAAPTSLSTGGRAGSKASLESCLRQVKMRDLLKASIPVPTDGGVGKSTAQELADRMQFVGTMGEVGGLAALVYIPNRGPGTFRVGDRVAEFVLKDVQPDRLTLELGEEQAILKR